MTQLNGVELRHFREIDSTNEEACRLGKGGIAGPLWILADRQMSGRGRRGRDWQSPAGNLCTTLLFRPDRDIARCAQLSFAAALAAGELVVRYAPHIQVTVKWPNDVLADERKIAGILLEAASNGANRPDWLAVGFGVNLKWHPIGVEYPATSLAQLGAVPPDPREALESLAGFWTKWYFLWLEQGFAPIRDAWLARAAGLGRRIRARLADGERSGVFEGIDESGALLLRERADCLSAITAGEVFF